MATNFKVGDTVRLKSTGPKMTITEITPVMGSDNVTIKCTWFDGKNLQTITLDPLSLVKDD